MSRPKSKTSKGTLYNLGLKPDQEKKLHDLLEKRGLSVRRLARVLIKQWVEEDGPGNLNFK